MNIEFDELKLMLVKAPLAPNESFPLGASPLEIEEVETMIHCRLPTDLKSWLAVANAVCVGGGGFVGVNAKRKSLDLCAIFDNYPSWKENSWFPVASDGSGNYYVLVANGIEKGVAFIDVAEDSETLTYRVASNLQVFVSRFIEKESGDSRWPFDKLDLLKRDPAVATSNIAPLPWE